MARDMQRLQQSKLRGAVLSQRKQWTPPEQGFVASASLMSGSNQSNAQRMELRSKMSADSWQSEAWNWIDLSPEFRYAVAWVGNLLSRASLTVIKDGDTLTPEESSKWLDQIYGGRGNHPEMLRMLGVHFTVAGEAYLILGTDAFGNDEWVIAPAIDVKENADGSYTIGDGITYSNATAIRMWRPHPRHILKSDAPSRAVLPTLAQAFNAEQHITAQLQSRLTSNGLLLLPQEVSIGKSSTSTTDSDGDTVQGVTNATPDEFVKMLIDTANIAIANPGSPAAQIPIVVQVPQDALEHIKKIDFWGKLDDKVIGIRAEAIHRLALGMDMPPEVLEGTSDLNHWSSWQVEEAAIKAHTEPLLDQIAASLTEGILRPLLIADGMSPEDASHYSIGADTSKLRLRPNRSQEAAELYDRGELSGDALRRENGFEPDDQMTKEQKQMWLLMQLVKSTSGSPEMLNAALRALGVPLQILPEDSAAGGSTTNDDGEPNNGVRATPSLADHPTRDIPADPGNDTNVPDALIAAGDVLVHRALERAGNRLKARLNRKVTGPASQAYQSVSVKAEEVNDLLAGAWDICPETASRYGGDAEQFTARIDAYTRGLLVTGAAHDPRAFASALTI
jgi:hypothetical protein